MGLSLEISGVVGNPVQPNVDLVLQGIHLESVGIWADSSFQPG